MELTKYRNYLQIKVADYEAIGNPYYLAFPRLLRKELGIEFYKTVDDFDSIYKNFITETQNLHCFIQMIMGSMYNSKGVFSTAKDNIKTKELYKILIKFTGSNSSDI